MEVKHKNKSVEVWEISKTNESQIGSNEHLKKIICADWMIG